MDDDLRRRLDRIERKVNAVGSFVYIFGGLAVLLVMGDIAKAYVGTWLDGAFLGVGVLVLITVSRVLFW